MKQVKTLKKVKQKGINLTKYVKDLNEGNYDIDLTEAEDIKKRWQEHTEELCKKIFMTQIIMIV